MTMTELAAPVYVGRACVQCGSTESHVRVTGRDNFLQRDRLFYISACDRCGLLFQNPSVDPSTLGEHYPDEYEPFQVNEEFEINRTAWWYLKHRKGYDHLAERAVPGWLRQQWGRWTAGQLLMPTFVRGGRVLEIGCASGTRLKKLKALGWAECTGIEFSPYAALVARNKGLDVHTGRVEDVIDALPEQNAVIASFVVEHLEDPYAVTERVAARLAPGGEFIFSTVNVDSLDRRLYGDFWLHWDLPRHFTYFRLRDLQRMLSPYFDITGIYYKTSTNDFVGSSRYRLLRGHGTWFDRWLTGIREQRVQKACVLLAWLRHTSRICIHARKR